MENVETRNESSAILDGFKRALVFSAVMFFLKFLQFPAIQIASAAGQIGTSFIGGFESWGRSFGRP